MLNDIKGFVKNNINNRFFISPFLFELTKFINIYIKNNRNNKQIKIKNGEKESRNKKWCIV